MRTLVHFMAVIAFAITAEAAMVRVDCALGIESRCDEIRAGLIRTPPTGEEQ